MFNNCSITPSFGGKHMPRNFSSMMNYIYKKTFKNFPNTFETKDIIKVTTTLDDGRELSGFVHFDNGKYRGLVLENAPNRLKTVFAETALRHYNENIASKSTKSRLKQFKNNSKLK